MMPECARNAYAERWIKSAKEGRLWKPMFFGKRAGLRTAEPRIAFRALDIELNLGPADHDVSLCRSKPRVALCS
jgi:hypothetical protein